MKNTFQPKKPVPTFWVTNVSNRNVSLTDLALTIRAFTTVNLLDSRHYTYTQEQLEKSHASGSLYLKRRMIRKRQVAPPPDVKEKLPLMENAIIPTRERSILDIKEEQYAELDLSDEKADVEKFAEENADLADMDSKPQIVKKDS